jgi:predicted AlkP superfamily phosphohydrolase/phosphomutase
VVRPDCVVHWCLSIFVNVVDRRAQAVHGLYGLQLACIDGVVNGVLAVSVNFVDVQAVFD